MRILFSVESPNLIPGTGDGVCNVCGMNELNSVHPAFLELLLCAELGARFAKYSQPNRVKKEFENK